MALRGRGAAATATSAPGARSWRTTPSPRSWAASATTRARRACNRGQLDESVGINSVERFLGDEAIAHGWQPEVTRRAQSGKRVLVVGAGPSGLSAAYYLTRLGHEVTIHDAGPMAGGMMRFGIPKYRLPRDVLDAEVQRILDMGVELELDSEGHERARGACGRAASTRLPRGRRAHRQARLHTGGRGGADPRRGRAAAQHGGRGAAAAGPAGGGLWRRQHGDGRGAHRQAARRDEAIVVYRRTRDRMPAHDFEVEEASREGVS